MIERKDQMQRTVRLSSAPKRIVSLVPSQTQLLHAFGLEKEVVGITKFCIHPDDWFRSKTRVGGTKTVSLDKVRALEPDLIIGNKEENERSDIEQLEKEFPVWMSDIYNLHDALEMIRDLGSLTGKSTEANRLAVEIAERFEALEKWRQLQDLKQQSVAYLIWHDPAFAAGSNTFIDAMLKRCGWENYMQEVRYPELTEHSDSQPDVVFLSSEPFPFKEAHIQTYRQRFPNAIIRLVDGEMFSWYGSKLVEAPSYFQGLIEEVAAK